MIDHNLILTGLHTTLTGYAGLTALVPAYKIEKSRAVNCDENTAGTGWISVFPGDVTYNPRTLSRSASAWAATVQLIVVVQWADVMGGEETTESIDDVVNQVLAAVNADKTLAGSWDMLTQISVRPRVHATGNEPGEIALSYQSRYITLTGEARP